MTTLIKEIMFILCVFVFFLSSFGLFPEAVKFGEHSIDGRTKKW